MPIDDALVEDLFDYIDTESEEELTKKALALLTQYPELARVRFSDYDVPTKTNADTNTVLHNATLYMNRKIVQQVIALGADVNAQNSWDETPLKMAIISEESGESQEDEARRVVVEWLLEAGADPNLADKDGLTPLHWTKSLSDWKTRQPILELLLRYGADPNQQTNAGVTSVYVYAYDLPELRFLVEHEGDVNLAAHDGDTPLMVAARTWYSDCVKFLLAHGANIKQKDRAGRSAVHHAAMRYSQAEEEPELWNQPMQMLLEAGADPNERTRYGFTPLHIAASVCNTATAACLLKAGVDINARDQKGRTPLKIAENRKELSVEPEEGILHEEDYQAMIRFLLDRGATH